MLKYVFILMSFVIVAHSKNTSVIKLQQGSIVGIENGDIREYYGIPYGRVVERFEVAEPPLEHEGIFSAINKNNECVQIKANTNQTEGKEDCLTLNIYTPSYPSGTQPIPVMFYIHGGAFVTGSNVNLVYYPKTLVQKGVIVVRINYRLGAFGFLCLNTEGAQGNVGLKDQVLALQWVRNNIKQFGGDPDLITIFGQSAGSVSVSHHLLSPLSKGLFHRAIMESGVSLSQSAIDNNPIQKASQVAFKLVNKTTLDPEELLEIYKQATAADIVLQTATFDAKNYIPNHYHFRPCMESENLESPFISETPVDILRKGNFHKVPVIIGYNSKEGIYNAPIYLDDEVQNESINKDFAGSLPDLVFKNENDKAALSNEIKMFYFGDTDIGNHTVDGLVNYLTDNIIFPSILNSKYILEKSDEPVYNYVFKYVSNKKYGNKLTAEQQKNIVGAPHTAELYSIFNQNNEDSVNAASDEAVMDIMTSLWTNFAKFGKPTLNDSLLLPFDWSPSEDSELKFLIMDREFEMGGLPVKERMNFWLDLYKKYGR